MLEILNLIAKGKKPGFSGEEVQKLLASDGAAGDYFGYSVAISSDSSVIVVGAYADDDNGTDSGSVYVFTKESNGEYVQSQKLLANDGAAFDYFGFSVTVSSDGSIIAAGSPYDDDKGSSSGSVYVFTKQTNSSYIQSQKLIASDGATNDYFGYSVEVNGDGSVIVVGAYQDDDKGSNSGSVYVFTKQPDSNYTQSQKLLANDGAIGDYFGCSVAVSSDSSVIIVGSFRDDDKGESSGSAYVFTKKPDGSYLQSQKLTASDGSPYYYFGVSVDASSDSSVIVVGSHYDGDKGPESGSVYVFTKQSNGTYVQSQKLVAGDGAADDRFGISVSISGDGSVIAVGAYKDDDRGTDSGSTYVFTKQSDGLYIESQKLLASDGAYADYFGYTAAVNGDGSVILVGAYQDDDKGNESGSVYVFN